MNEYTLVKAACQIYRIYRELGLKTAQRPTGVIIDRSTYRGRLAFASKPILLPQEYFVSLSEIESEGD